MRRLISTVAVCATLLAGAGAADAAVAPSFEGGNGTAGLPTCNAITFGMYAYNVWGRGYLCTAMGGYFYWLRIN